MSETDKLNAIEQIRSCGFEAEELAVGGYGTVFSVRDHEGLIYALKYIKEPSYSCLGFKVLSEIDILRRIKHPHIIHSPLIITSLSCKLEDSLAIIMPLGDVTLYTAILNNLYNIETKLSIMYKLTTALEFLHRHGILHLDIKSPNIVLRGTEPYLIDFGLSMFVQDAKRGRYSDYELVTPINRPPEIFAGGRQYNAAVDIWSLGMVMLSLLSGTFLFPNTIDWADVYTVLQESKVIVGSLPKLLENIDNKYRKQCLSLLQGMLTFNPKQRLTAVQIMTHPLFSDVRTIISGHILEPIYNPVYAKDHRDILKIMLVWAQEIFVKFSARLLLLAIDIYNRAGTFYLQSTRKDRIALAAMSLITALKISEDIYPSLNEYLMDIKQLTPDIPEITISKLLQAETEIIHYLEGILYRSPFFDKLTTGDELIITFSRIIMDQDSALYLQVDYDAWVVVVKQFPSENRYPSKHITINQLLSK